jgi:hypothetical protein
VIHVREKDITKLFLSDKEEENKIWKFETLSSTPILLKRKL